MATQEMWETLVLVALVETRVILVAQGDQGPLAHLEMLDQRVKVETQGNLDYLGRKDLPETGEDQD